MILITSVPSSCYPTPSELLSEIHTSTIPLLPSMRPVEFFEVNVSEIEEEAELI